MHSSPENRKYTELCSTYGFKQLVHGSTRIRCDTYALIDHILTNAGEHISQSGTIDTAISNHFIIYCTRKIPKV